MTIPNGIRESVGTACSRQDRIRPGVIIIVAAAILAAVAMPFAVIRAIWPETKPVPSTPAGKLTDHASNDECVVRIPDGVRGFKITASNSVLRLDLSTSNLAERQSVEIGQDRVLCLSHDGQKLVQGRSVRLTRDGMTILQGRGGKLTMTRDNSTTVLQAIGDRIHMLKDGKDMASAKTLEFNVPQAPPQSDAKGK